MEAEWKRQTAAGRRRRRLERRPRSCPLRQRRYEAAGRSRLPAPYKQEVTGSNPVPPMVGTPLLERSGAPPVPRRIAGGKALGSDVEARTSGRAQSACLHGDVCEAQYDEPAERFSRALTIQMEDIRAGAASRNCGLTGRSQTSRNRYSGRVEESRRGIDDVGAEPGWRRGDGGRRHPAPRRHDPALVPRSRRGCGRAVSPCRRPVNRAARDGVAELHRRKASPRRAHPPCSCGEPSRGAGAQPRPVRGGERGRLPPRNTDERPAARQDRHSSGRPVCCSRGGRVRRASRRDRHHARRVAQD